MRRSRALLLLRSDDVDDCYEYSSSIVDRNRKIQHIKYQWKHRQLFSILES
jgi:hypothetical protein